MAHKPSHAETLNQKSHQDGTDQAPKEPDPYGHAKGYHEKPGQIGAYHQQAALGEVKHMGRFINDNDAHAYQTVKGTDDQPACYCL